MIRRAAHIAVVTLGFLAWAPAMFLLVFSAWCSVRASKIIPHSDTQNCWSYALYKFSEYGGHLLIKRAPGQKFLKVFDVYHVSWVKHYSGEDELRYFNPVNRKTASWFPYYVVYYEGKIGHRERASDADPDSSQPSPPEP